MICANCKRRGHRVEDCRKKKRNSEPKKKANTKKGQQSKKRDENNSKEKYWTLFVTDQAPDNAVCSPNDEVYNNEYDSSEDEGKERTIEWILDSGCGRHLTGNASLFSSAISSASTTLYLPDGSIVQSMKRGTVSLRSIVAEVSNNLDISDVPGLTKNCCPTSAMNAKAFALSMKGRSAT
jgi:hypothetical protein